MLKRFQLASFCALTTAALAGSPAVAAPSSDWIGAWSASVQPLWAPDFPLPIGLPRSFWMQTLRQTVRTSVGGHKLRLVLSNEYGDAALPVSAADVAISDGGAKIKDGTDHALTFAGSAGVSIPPGARMISDPIDLDAPALTSLSVSLYFGDNAPATTVHWEGVQTAYLGGFA